MMGELLIPFTTYSFLNFLDRAMLLRLLDSLFNTTTCDIMIGLHLFFQSHKKEYTEMDCFESTT